MKIIISKTSESELQAAIKHLIYAKANVSQVVMKTDKKNGNKKELAEIYKEIYQTNEKLEKLLKKCDVRHGFK